MVDSWRYATDCQQPPGATGAGQKWSKTRLMRLFMIQCCMNIAKSLVPKDYTCVQPGCSWCLMARGCASVVNKYQLPPGDEKNNTYTAADAAVVFSLAAAAVHMQACNCQPLPTRSIPKDSCVRPGCSRCLIASGCDQHQAPDAAGSTHM